MLTPDYLLESADEIAELYSDLHTSTLNSISRHVAKAVNTGRLTSTAVRQIENAQAIGLMREEIIVHVSKTLKVAEPLVRDLLTKAAVKTLEYDNKIYREAGLPEVFVKNSPTMQRILESAISRNIASVRNLTGAFTASAEFKMQEMLDDLHRQENLAYMKVVSGTHSYTEALKDAVTELAKRGVTTYDYKSGRGISIESAILRNMRTAISQTAGEITKQGMIETGCTHVEVSAHQGARNKDIVGRPWANHESWQGRVFFWSELAQSIGNTGVDENNNLTNSGNSYRINNIYTIAVDGGKNNGAYVTLSSQTDNQLLRSVRSFNKNVEEHKNKIAAPDKYVDDWESQDDRYKEGIVKLWTKDMNKNREQLIIAQTIAGERGIYNE